MRRRALKRARSVVRQRIAGQRGINYNKLSISDKIAIDRMADKRKKQIARIATRQCGYSPEIVGDESKPTGVLSRVGDTTKQKLMGFSSSISIDKGIAEWIEYFQMHLN